MTTGIYGLIDPRTGLVNYVGQALDIQDRYRRHLKSNETNGKSEWISELRILKMRPLIVVLEECELEMLDNSERWWVAHGTRLGWPLTNVQLNTPSRSTESLVRSVRQLRSSIRELARETRQRKSSRRAIPPRAPSFISPVSPVSPELDPVEAKVRRLVQEGNSNKVKIIKEVWEASPGKGNKYVAASAEYERIVAAMLREALGGKDGGEA